MAIKNTGATHVSHNDSCKFYVKLKENNSEAMIHLRKILSELIVQTDYCPWAMAIYKNVILVSHWVTGIENF